jgi:hypothetical protein
MIFRELSVEPSSTKITSAFISGIVEKNKFNSGIRKFKLSLSLRKGIIRLIFLLVSISVS